MASSLFRSSVKVKQENAPETVARLFYNARDEKYSSPENSLLRKSADIANYCLKLLSICDSNQISSALSKLKPEDKRALISEWNQWIDVRARLLAYYYLPMTQWQQKDTEGLEEALKDKDYYPLLRDMDQEFHPLYNLYLALIIKKYFYSQNYKDIQPYSSKAIWHLNLEGLQAKESGPYFEYFRIFGANFMNANFNCSASFYKCDLFGSTFQNARISNDVDFTKADVAAVDLDGVLPIPDSSGKTKFKFALTGIPHVVIKQYIELHTYDNNLRAITKYMNTWQMNHSCLSFFGKTIPKTECFAIAYLRGVEGDPASLNTRCDELQKHFEGGFAVALSTLKTTAQDLQVKTAAQSR